MQPNFILTQSLLDTSVVLEEITELTFDDLCRACSAQADIVDQLITEGVIEFTFIEQGQPQEDWRFTGVHLQRAKVAMRLHRDLGVNFAGAALALQLMDELNALREKLRSVAF